MTCRRSARLSRQCSWPQDPTLARALSSAHVLSRNSGRCVRRPEGVSDELVTQCADINNRAGAVDRVNAYIKTQHKVWDATDVPALFGRLKTPMLLQWGDGGKVLPPFVGDIVRDQLKNAPLTMARYPDAGHMPMLELQQQTAEDALRFMQQPIAKTE